MNRNESERGGPTGTCPGTTTALLGEVSQRRASVQHTPGPWGVFGAQDSSTDEWRALTVSQESMPFMRVCFMPSDGTETIMSNARLIAAAPDLLALAQQYASECSECNGTGLRTITTHPGGIEVDNDDQPCQDCADIRAVITKATSVR